MGNKKQGIPIWLLQVYVHVFTPYYNKLPSRDQIKLKSKLEKTFWCAESFKDLYIFLS